MRAIRFNAFGDPSVLDLAEVAAPAVGETTALVRVMTASINPSDVKNVAGAMKQTTLPRIPGRDFAGVVEAGPPEWIGGRSGAPASPATELRVCCSYVGNRRVINNLHPAQSIDNLTRQKSVWPKCRGKSILYSSPAALQCLDLQAAGTAVHIKTIFIRRDLLAA